MSLFPVFERNAFTVNATVTIYILTDFQWVNIRLAQFSQKLQNVWCQKVAAMTLFLMTHKEIYKETSNNLWSDRDLADIHRLTGEQIIFSLHALMIIAIITVTYWFSESIFSKLINDKSLNPRDVTFFVMFL